MSTWLIVWFTVALVSTAAVLACLVALVRHALVLGRSAREFQEAVKPLTDAISADGRRASERSGSLRIPGRPAPPGRG